MATTIPKGAAFLKRARPDLAEMPGNNVQARVTVGMCDDRGVPRNKARFFVVTPRVARQVQMGSATQDRSDPHPSFAAWNFNKGAVSGRQSFRIRIQHAEIDAAYDIGCICFRDPDAPKPPGKSPYCKSNDMVTANRWDGAKFATIQCGGSACPLRQERQDNRGNKIRLAKDRFVLVGRLDVPEFEPILVSVATGSDYNFAQFMALVQSTERQWSDMCRMAGMDLPMPWYGRAIDLSVYESTGDNSRFPRIHYSPAFSIEEVFQAAMAFYERMKGLKGLAECAPMLALPAASELTADSEALDAQEVLSPVDASTAEPTQPANTRAGQLAAKLNYQPKTTVIEQPASKPEPATVDVPAMLVMAKLAGMGALGEMAIAGGHGIAWLTRLKGIYNNPQATDDHRNTVSMLARQYAEPLWDSHGEEIAPMLKACGLQVEEPAQPDDADDIPL